MKASEPALQGAVTVAVSWIAARLGVLFVPVILLMVMMALDYVTGMLAAKAEAIAHPENPEYGWSSRKGILGIIKKIGYIILVVVAVSLDHILVQAAAPLGVALPRAIFGLLVTVWLVLNEMLSIVENAGRMGAPVPPWLARCVASLKDKIDQEADKEADADE
jgi:toxin secretion/phage lysis holin